MRIWVSDGDRRLQEGSGYGQLSRAISRGLLESGHEVQFQQFPNMELALFICPPGNIRFGRAVPCAAITMHELDHLPEAKQHWPAILNRLDLVITPTEWNREVWQREGVRTPIAVVPLGVDPSLYFPVTGLSCTFMCVHENLGGDTSRENWRETLLAYCSTFTSEDDVRLLVKTWKWKRDRYEAALAEVLSELGIDERTAPAIEVIDDELSAEQLRDLYQRAWLFVKNANREGWSMPCSEAVACGTRVAAVNIEPLRSHLPEETRWFAAGDVSGLADLLRHEHLRFRSHLRRCQRSDATATTKLVEIALEGMVRDRRTAGSLVVS
ncbi:MAG TPA: glycosyltransferase [Solirubrobacteraceae bacterium]|nr:glycosyltransferase [Solirubrobacteraceae bacterium]